MSLSPEVLPRKDEYQRYRELGGRIGVRQFNWAVQLIRNKFVRERLIREEGAFQQKSFVLSVSKVSSLNCKVDITEEEASIYSLLRCKQAPIDKTGEDFSRMCDQSLLVETFLLILVTGDGDRNVLKENLKKVLQKHAQFPSGVKKKYERVLVSLVGETA